MTSRRAVWTSGVLAQRPIRGFESGIMETEGAGAPRAGQPVREMLSSSAVAAGGAAPAGVPPAARPPPPARAPRPAGQVRPPTAPPHPPPPPAAHPPPSVGINHP